MMTRKNFQALADGIQEVRASLDCDPAYTDAINAVAERIATICKADNSNFNRQRFLDACGN
jgi:hypothetical protein